MEEKKKKTQHSTFLGLQSHCSHEIKRPLLLGRKAMTKLESILKSRVITLPTKILIIKAIVFPVVMSGCESWTTNKTECWCSRRLLRVPWTAKRSNQSVLREVNPEYSLEQLTDVEAPKLWSQDAKSQ